MWPPPGAPPEAGLLSAPVTGEEWGGGEANGAPDLVPSPPLSLSHLPVLSSSFSTLILFSYPISGLLVFSLTETFTELRVLLMPVDLCPYSECELCVQCALQADDISCDRHACLRWVDRRGIWYIAYVFTARLWGAGRVYASRVLLLLVYDASLRTSVAVVGYPQAVCVCVCMRAYHAGLRYLPFAYGSRPNLPGGAVYTCVTVRCLCCGLAGREGHVVCICVLWIAFALWFCILCDSKKGKKNNTWAVCCVCAVFIACAVCRCAVRMLPVSCVPVSVKCVPVFPRRLFLPFGCPSLPPSPLLPRL